MGGTRPRPASCPSVPASQRLVVALEGVQAGLQAQGVAVGQVGGAEQVQARQQLHVPDPGRVQLQQLLHPLGLVLSALDTNRERA